MGTSESHVIQSLAFFLIDSALAFLLLACSMLGSGLQLASPVIRMFLLTARKERSLLSIPRFGIGLGWLYLFVAFCS